MVVNSFISSCSRSIGLVFSSPLPPSGHQACASTKKEKVKEKERKREEKKQLQLLPPMGAFIVQTSVFWCLLKTRQMNKLQNPLYSFVISSSVFYKEWELLLFLLLLSYYEAEAWACLVTVFSVPLMGVYSHGVSLSMVAEIQLGSECCVGQMTYLRDWAVWETPWEIP